MVISPVAHTLLLLFAPIEVVAALYAAALGSGVIAHRHRVVLHVAVLLIAVTAALGLLGAAYVEAVRYLEFADRRCGSRLGTAVHDCAAARRCDCASSRHDSARCPAECPAAAAAPRTLWTYLDTGRPWSSENLWIRAAWRSWQVHAIANGYVIRTVNRTEALRANVRYPIPEWMTTLPWNHQGDFVSFALLLEHGGLYLDSDTMLVSSPDSFLEHTSQQEFVAFDHVNYKVGGCGLVGHHHGAMASRPDSAVLRMYYVNIIRFYEDVHGCMGARCTNGDFTTPALGWLDTLNYAFAGDAAAGAAATPHRTQGYIDLVAEQPCSVMRLPYSDFEWNQATAAAAASRHRGLVAERNQECLVSEQWNVELEPHAQHAQQNSDSILTRVKNAPRQHPQPGVVVGGGGAAASTGASSGALAMYHLSPLKNCLRSGRVAKEVVDRLTKDIWGIILATSHHDGGVGPGELANQSSTALWDDETGLSTRGSSANGGGGGEAAAADRPEKTPLILVAEADSFGLKEFPLIREAFLQGLLGVT